MENIYIVLLMCGIASVTSKAMVPDTATEEGLSYERRIRRAVDYNEHGGGTDSKSHWPPRHRKIKKDHHRGKMPHREYELEALYGKRFKVNAKVPNHSKISKGAGKNRRPSWLNKNDTSVELDIGQLFKNPLLQTHVKDFKHLPGKIFELHDESMLAPKHPPDFEQSDEQMPTPDYPTDYEQIEQPSEPLPNYPSDYEKSAEHMPMPDYPTDYYPDAETSPSTNDHETSSNIEESDMCDKPAKYANAKEKLKSFFTKIKANDYSKQIQDWLNTKKEALIRKGADKLNELVRNYDDKEKEGDDTSHKAPASDSNNQKGVARTRLLNLLDDDKREKTSWLGKGIARMRLQDPNNSELYTSYSLRQYY